MKETFRFKDLLELWENDKYTKIVLFAKYDVKLSDGTAKEHLEKSKNIFNRKVLYHGLNSYGELVVVLNVKSKQDVLKIGVMM